LFDNVMPRHGASLLRPAYVVATLAMGWIARTRSHSAGGFLNASRSLPLPIVVASFLAANCGALEVIGLSAMAAQYGVQAMHFYAVGAIPAIIFLALWMMPVYRRSRIVSVPEYLEKRFDKRVRLLYACIVAITLLLLGGISLYALAQVLQVAAGLNFAEGITLSAAVVLAYILLGGLRATIYNEVFQLALMIAGLAPLALRSRRVALAVRAQGHGSAAHLWSALPFASTQAPMDKLGLLLGLGFVLSFGYWCTDFVLMQRAFTARTDEDARQVPLWAGFGKLCFSLLVILPGLAAGALFPALSRSQHFDQALPQLMVHEYGPMMLALGMTAIVATLMSSLAANVSAFAAVATHDVYRAQLAPDASDSQTLRAGRYVLISGILISLAASYLNFLFHNLMEHVQLIFSVFAAPFWAVFLLGMGPRRANARGALAGFFAGTGIALLHLIATARGWLHYGSNMTANFHVAIYAFTAALLTGWLASGSPTPPLGTPANTGPLVFEWRAAWTGPGWRPLWILSLLLAAACLAINVAWR
jgi:SSS family solute:Na+ symporter